MPRSVSASQMAAAYQQGIAGGASKYKAGVMGVTDNPCAAAAAKVNDGTWLAAVSQSGPRMAAALSSVSLDQWKAAAAGVGATNFAGSVAKAGPKYAAKTAALAQAATQASQAAHSATGPLEKVRASINAFKTAFGKPPI